MVYQRLIRTLITSCEYSNRSVCVLVMLRQQPEWDGGKESVRRKGFEESKDRDFALRIL